MTAPCLPPLRDMAIIPLAYAYWCEDCQAFVNRSRACPACGSSNLYPPAAWLGEESEK